MNRRQNTFTRDSRDKHRTKNRDKIEFQQKLPYTPAEGMSDYEMALELQQRLLVEEQQEALAEEAASRELALSLAIEADRDAMERNTQMLQDEQLARQLQQSCRPTYASITGVKQGADMLAEGFWEFVDETGTERVSYSKHMLTINFLTKEYSIQLPLKTRQLLSACGSAGSSEVVPSGPHSSQGDDLYCFRDLEKEVSVKASETDPIEIRYVASSLKGTSIDDYLLLNRLAARCFIYRNNDGFRAFLEGRRQARDDQVHSPLVLDLHGLFVKEAKKRLIPFFKCCSHYHVRKCVVIVGSGNHSKQGISALRTYVAQKLDKMKAVISFKSRAVLNYNYIPPGHFNIKINLESPVLK